MSTNVIIQVHHEQPELSNKQTTRNIIAYNRKSRRWDSELDVRVHNWWGQTYTAWYDPNIGYVAKENSYYAAPSKIWDGLFQVYNEDGHPCSLAVTTMEAAERIAEVYDEISESIR